MFIISCVLFVDRRFLFVAVNGCCVWVVVVCCLFVVCVLVVVCCLVVWC